MGMTRDSSGFSVHPPGEQSLVVENERPDGVDLDSFFGPVRVEWDHEAALTPLGQLLFDALVADCPLRYGSPNAPKKRDVVGTAMLAMLAGHKRYAHIAALRCDAVLPELLGMSKIVSEDAVRRAIGLQRCLDAAQQEIGDVRLVVDNKDQRAHAPAPARGDAHGCARRRPVEVLQHAGRALRPPL